MTRKHFSPLSISAFSTKILRGKPHAADPHKTHLKNKLGKMAMAQIEKEKKGKEKEKSKEETDAEQARNN